jgi:hypothetical protein
MDFAPDFQAALADLLDMDHSWDDAAGQLLDSRWDDQLEPLLRDLTPTQRLRLAEVIDSVSVMAQALQRHALPILKDF